MRAIAVGAMLGVEVVAMEQGGARFGLLIGSARLAAWAAYAIGWRRQRVRAWAGAWPRPARTGRR